MSDSTHTKSSVILQKVSEVFAYKIHKSQRALNKQHINKIIEDQVNEYSRYGCFSILQAISIAIVANDTTKAYVLDGQHRREAFLVLEKMGYNVKDVLVPVVVYRVIDETEMLKYFNMINQNMPIHPLELQSDYVDCGKVLVENMTKIFGIYMKHDSKNSRCPHINMNDFKKNLAGRHKLADALEQKGKSVIELWAKVIEFNTYVKDNMKASHQLCPMMSKRLTDCETKATKLKSGEVCYLGVWRRFEWLDFSLVALLEGKQFGSEINLSCEPNTKVPIPYTVREQVWKKCNQNTSDLGICFTCCNDLYFRDMQCGHVKAHALGGDTTIENLMPVCKSCNNDMGVMNLFEYKEMIEKMSH